MYATEALQGGDASRKDVRRRGRRLLGCVHKQSGGMARRKEIEERMRHNTSSWQYRDCDVLERRVLMLPAHPQRERDLVVGWVEFNCELS